MLRLRFAVRRLLERDMILPGVRPAVTDETEPLPAVSNSQPGAERQDRGVHQVTTPRGDEPQHHLVPAVPPSYPWIPRQREPAENSAQDTRRDYDQ